MTSSSDAEKRRNLCRWRTSAAAHPVSKRGCAKATCWRCRISASEVTAGMACICSCVSFSLRTCSTHIKDLREACGDAGHNARPVLQLLMQELAHLQHRHPFRQEVSSLRCCLQWLAQHECAHPSELMVPRHMQKVHPLELGRGVLPATTKHSRGLLASGASSLWHTC